jgi:hypothetical protein
VVVVHIIPFFVASRLTTRKRGRKKMDKLEAWTMHPRTFTARRYHDRHRWIQVPKFESQPVITTHVFRKLVGLTWSACFFESSSKSLTSLGPGGLRTVRRMRLVRPIMWFGTGNNESERERESNWLSLIYQSLGISSIVVVFPFDEKIHWFR